MDTHITDTAILDRLNRGYIDAVQASDAAWFDAHLSPDFLNSTRTAPSPIAPRFWRKWRSGRASRSSPPRTCASACSGMSR